MKRVLMALTCGLLWAASASAQTCQGAMTYTGAPTRFGADLTFTSNTHDVLVGAGKGTSNLFYGGGLVLAGTSDIGTAKGIFASVGSERASGAEKKYLLCPEATIMATFGLHPAPDTDVSTTIFDVGASFGWIASKSGTTEMVPTAGITFNAMRNSWSGGGFDFSGTDTFGSILAGLGVVMNDRMSLTPAVVLSFGSDNTETAFTVAFRTKIGN